MKFTEFKTSAIILSVVGGVAVGGMYFLPGVPSEAFWAVAGGYVMGLVGIAKDLVNPAPAAGDSEMFKLAMKVLDQTQASDSRG